MLDGYLHLIPAVVVWLLDVEAHILKNGRVLTAQETADAIDVGVQHPEKIRLLTVAAISEPAQPELIEAGRATGLLTDLVAARAIRYGVEILQGQSSRILLRHEFRHVQQFEQAESFEGFITSYIQSVLEYGYLQSPYEQDARAHELPQ